MRLARAAAPELCERAKSFFLHTRCRSEASGSSWVGFPGSLAMRWKLGSSLKASSLSETSRGASSSFRGVLQRALQVPAPRTPTLVGFPDSRQPVSQYDDPWRLFPEIWESSRRWAQTLAGRATGLAYLEEWERWERGQDVRRMLVRILVRFCRRLCGFKRPSMRPRILLIGLLS